MKASAMVLLYHRIVDDPPELLDFSPSGITIRRDAFDAQMQYILARYRVIPLSRLADMVSKRSTLEDGLCAVTFDDGWRDNYTHAFPIIKQHKVPCTIFLANNFIDGSQWFWESRLKYVLGHIVQRFRDGRVDAADGQVVRQTLARHNAAVVLEQPLPELRRFLTALVNKLRAHSPREVSMVIAELEELLRLPTLHEPRRFLNWDEIREMEAAGIDFGVHTMSHLNLERCDLDTAGAEIKESKSVTARSLKRAVPLFAYPFGKSTQAVRRLVADAGFTGGFTTRLGFVKGDSDPFQLNRIDIHESVAGTLPLFACRALRVLPIY
jgi:peptidoglycan/xylan/chitin deacetylase (PgdA/CDA1 family)